MRAQQRLFVVVGAMLLAMVGGFTLMAQDAPTPTPGATASPEASPGASPEASPIASPEALLGDVAAGQLLATQCLACHSADGSTLVGPTWKDLYGKTETLEDGSTVKVDYAYLEQSIRDPMSQIVEGFPPAMPPYDYMTDQQIADLIAYIASLDTVDD
jgi:cytochrome c oxidase subunit 2